MRRLERDRMITAILRFEADGEDHSGVQIDQHLREVARDLGYFEKDLEEMHTSSNRGVFANDGDWAKATMTADKLHEVVRIDSYADARGKRHHCHVYRITPMGFEEHRGRSAGLPNQPPQATAT